MVSYDSDGKRSTNYIMIQHRRDFESLTTSLVWPENLGTAPVLGVKMGGLICTWVSCFPSGMDVRLGFVVELTLFSTGLPFVLICARCFFKSANVPVMFKSMVTILTKFGLDLSLHQFFTTCIHFFCKLRVN